MYSLSMLLQSSDGTDDITDHKSDAAADAHSEASGDDGKDVISYTQTISHRYFSDHS